MVQPQNDREKTGDFSHHPSENGWNISNRLELIFAYPIWLGFMVIFGVFLYNVGKTIINHPPVITMFIGDMFTIPSQWFMAVPNYDGTLRQSDLA